MSTKDLIIIGARQNNLKNINLTLPHNKVIAITRVSGSEKSSLAFDAVFADLSSAVIA
jgi:excinuclease ABC subunit A